MIDALYVAATGMHAEQTQLNTISNNLSNMNTTGFKKSQVRFDDLLYRDAVAANPQALAAGASRKVGMGASVSSITKVFSGGDLKPTGNTLDVAIGGAGFFEVMLDNGELAYSRNGALQVNDDGFLLASGYPLADRIQLPPDVADVAIGRDGSVVVRIDGDSAGVEVGRIGISYFLNDTGLEALGSGLYIPTRESGAALYAQAGTNGTGPLEQGFVEASNVDLIEELINLTVAQRGFEASSQVLRASDRLLQVINELRQ